MHPLKSRVTVVCGHYGTGKTNLSINLAMDCARAGDHVTLVDMDIVNPYFRSADYADMLTKAGVKVIGPNFANSNLDTPSLPGSIGVAIEDGERVIIDVGGDDAGATALAVYRRQLEAAEPDVLYVINKYRSLTTTPEEAVEILGEVERTAHIKATGIVNNSHLKHLTTAETIESSYGFAEKVCESTGLPLRFTTVPRGLSLSKEIEPLYQIDVHVRTPWEQDW
jgi:hypothetical protein